jgi:hypothetical protein
MAVMVAVIHRIDVVGVRPQLYFHKKQHAAAQQ